LKFLYESGRETENITTFSSCREYRAESALHFDQPGVAPGQKPATKAQPDTVPRGLRFTMQLVTPIDSDKAAAGDRFTAKLTGSLVDSKGHRLARSGTLVTGRLTRVQIRMATSDVVLMVRPETLEVPGGAMRINAFRNVPKYSALEKKEIVLRDRGEEGSEAFVLRGLHVVLPKGFRSEWSTSPPPPAPVKR
jgi:hypothetical protein